MTAITQDDDLPPKGMLGPDHDKFHDKQTEDQPGNLDQDASIAEEDPHSKALTRKLLFKLDTR